MRRLLLAILPIAIATRTLCAQGGDTLAALSARPAFSMGQPPRWLPYAVGYGVLGHDRHGGGALVGIRHPILNPVNGLLDVSAEALGEAASATSAVGLRLRAEARGIGFAVGADWRSGRRSVDPVLTYQTAIRRGGLIGHGSLLRVDWLPRAHTFGLGVQLPLMQPFAGKTRPKRTIAPILPAAIGRRISLARAFAATTTPMADTLARLARTISIYSSLYTPEDASVLDAAAHLPSARSYMTATRTYVATLSRLFAIATRDSARGDSLARTARAIVLDDFILPYDALFGQVKPNDAAPILLERARRHFASWLSDSSGIAASTRGAALVALDQWLAVLRDLARRSLDAWSDTRLVWISPALALAPEEYDEQSELDALIGRAVGHPFTDHNALTYLRTADLSVEIARSILAAQVYHVLWTHDFAVRRPTGELDRVGYTMVADAYLPALTAAVQRYDSTGTLPQYFLFLDAFYYHGRDERLWMSVLENPLDARVSLGRGATRETEHLRARLGALRDAVARSKRLQREAAANGGPGWLARVVKVHVNVTYPSDFSFRSSHLIPPLPFTPDNIARDHRKLVFYDFTETNPYAGELLAMGIGIGEHYASATWDDRGFRLRGPAALEARVALRRNLLGQGVAVEQIPEILREAQGHVQPDTNPRNVARALHVHNEPGFGAKESSVARAMLYTLAPSGSVIIVPDPLWLSASWGSMLAGAAARGSTVMVIAPSQANSPNTQPPVYALERDVLQHLLAIRRRLRAAPNAGRGELHVGLFAATAPLTDVSGRLAEIRAGLARAPWIRDVIPFDDATLSVLTRAVTGTGSADAAATSIASDITPRAPQLHQKTQLIARPGALAALARQPGWDEMLARTIRDQARASADLAETIGAPPAAVDTVVVRAAEQRLQGFQRSLTEAERRSLSFYLMVGSQNHDARGLMLDGEAGVLVSGFDASAGLVDLFFLMARTTWIDDDADIDRLVPAPSRFMAWLARRVRPAM
jgi:phosphatidylserine/phosphatidylglycerophosphate/cardiolipin synthase-like enzyme